MTDLAPIDDGEVVPHGAPRTTAAVGAGSARARDAADMVTRFADAWARPEVERFVALLHPDVVLLQPVTPPIRGRTAARSEFVRLLAWLPDMRGTMEHTAVRDSVALIAWRLAFSLGGRPFELRIVDRLAIEDGLIREREAYFDSLRFMLAVLRRPGAWPGYWRYRGFLGR